MLKRFWLEFPPSRIALFVAAAIALGIFWSLLPPEIRQELFADHGRRVGNPPRLMFGCWLTGWFLVLFVRAEDLNILAPIQVQAWCRIGGALLIGAALLIATFFAQAFFL